MDWTSAFLVAGGLAGGFISGLSGFGAGLVALPILLLVVPVTVAAQVAALCGLAGQLQTLPSLKHSLGRERLSVVVLSGLIGVGIGLWWIPKLPIGLFKSGVGTLLIAYSLFALALPERWRFYRQHPFGDLVMGVSGGLCGGIAGIPGPPIVMWAAVQHLSADNKRSMIQIFNVATLSFMLLASAGSGYLTWDFFTAALLVLPATMVGAYAGVTVYRRLNDQRYQLLVIALLLASGFAMILAG